jgi:transcriptional regulator with PAS, ATPase and Fis domain
VLCAARSDAKVLITGETGVGKEVVARLIHQKSHRARGPLVTVNCAGLPDSLLESELFGHVRGSFTGAYRDKPGLLEMADGGTLFLDELVEMPKASQAKLLRVIQDGVVRRVGSESTDAMVTVRFIAATNCDPEAAVRSGQLREDLYYRLCVVPIHLPPLRERREDVALLAEHFLSIYWSRHREKGAPLPTFGEAAARALRANPWRGNVRELQNTMERAVTLAANDHITVDDLADRIVSHKRSHVVLTDDAELVTLEEMEKRYILQVLQASGGSKSVAAKTLGLDRTTLWRKLERFRIEAPKQDD